jgi:GNAT superfamily N-acetyltransferase
MSACLSRAFQDDPISSFIFPQERSRLSRLGSFYREVIRMMSPHGVIYTDEEIRGAAIWRAPSPPRVGRLRATWNGLGMLGALRTSVGRAFLLEQIAGPARPREPHWYLAILGTDPSQQGRGVGSSLLLPVLERCDDEGLPAYLESSKQANIPFYRRHGFRVTEELKIPNGPSLWSMIRDPRSTG